LREERRVKVLEDSVLRKIFGTKRDEVTWDWKRLHDKEIRDLYVFLIKYLSSDEIKKNYVGGQVTHNEERSGACRVLVGRPEGKRTLGIPKSR
jgi:hypothetical protein